MTSRGGRIAVLLVFVAVAAILFVVLQDDGSDDDGGETTATTPTVEQTEVTVAPPPERVVEEIRMQNGAPVGGPPTLTYVTGDTVRIKVLLDEPQEDVHIHGYDIEVLNPQTQASFDFKADIEGIFELEAHGPSGDVVLAEIRVEPS